MKLDQIFRHLEKEQDMPEVDFFKERLGQITASRISSFLDEYRRPKIKTGNSQYILIGEKQSGLPYSPLEKIFQPERLSWGRAMEKHAIDYLFRTLTEVEGLKIKEIKKGEVVNREVLGDFTVSATPDGFIDELDALVEIKCLDTHLHLEILDKGLQAVPEYYVLQVEHQLFVTGASRCFLTFFDPRLPAGLSHFYIQIERDEENMRDINSALLSYAVEVSRKINDFKYLKEQKLKEHPELEKINAEILLQLPHEYSHYISYSGDYKGVYMIYENALKQAMEKRKQNVIHDY